MLTKNHIAPPGYHQDDLESLLSVPGVDMVQFGATDYSVSIGHPGQDGSELQRESHCNFLLFSLEI